MNIRSEPDQFLISRTLLELSELLITKSSLHEVFEGILDLLGRVVKFDSGWVLLLDGDHMSVRAWRNYDKF